MERTLRDGIVARDRFTCQSCRRPTRGQVHHILPRGQAGYDSPTNLITLCGRCQMLVSPMPLRVLKRLLRIGEQEIVTEKARVEVAIQAWILSKAQNDAHEESYGEPVSPAAAQQDRPIAEWKKLRPHAGKSWSSDDDNTLLADFSAGLSVEEIASRLGRGVFAVQVRLCKLGRIVTS